MIWKPWSKPESATPPCNVLLSNGRFPVALDLARQLKPSGATVYVVDSMHYHICKFSNSVKKSYWVPAPRADTAGYIDGVKQAITDSNIDIMIPVHEEIFYLAGCHKPEILNRLFAPPHSLLMQLHSKWDLIHTLNRNGLDAPATALCHSMDDLRNQVLSHELSMKPVFGRAASNVYHLKPGESLPDDVDIGDDNPYVMQDWVKGDRYCSYAVLREGKVRAFSLYPVGDTIDGDSCVYFESIEHQAIYDYVEKFAAALGKEMVGQVAFDFIETSDRLVVIDCNPRTTSGIHLFSGSPDLARALIGSSPYGVAIPKTGGERQVAPGMLMVPAGLYPNWGHFLRHLWRLVSTRDVMFKKNDLLPSLMQPFLLASYYQICHERGGMRLPDMFQWDYTWELGSKYSTPSGDSAEELV